MNKNSKVARPNGRNTTPSPPPSFVVKKENPQKSSKFLY